MICQSFTKTFSIFLKSILAPQVYKLSRKAFSSVFDRLTLFPQFVKASKKRGCLALSEISCRVNPVSQVFCLRFFRGTPFSRFSVPRFVYYSRSGKVTGKIQCLCGLTVRVVGLEESENIFEIRKPVFHAAVFPLLAPILLVTFKVFYTVQYGPSLVNAAPIEVVKAFSG